MSKPIGLQLYTLRDVLPNDFEGVIRRIAELGYAGVETAGFSGTTTADAAKLFHSLGLQVPAAHSPLPLGDKKNEVLETLGLLGCKYLVCAFIPPDEFKTVDQIKASCERLNEANAVARAAGYTLVYHNHWWEYQPVDGWYPYQVMVENLDPTVQFEIDTYWVKTAGLDPAAVIRELGDRVPLLHIKDGPANTEAPMLAVGEGVMDFPPIIEAADSAEWLIVELDRCATDMIEAVTKSYHYLVNKGLARGKQS